jgi:LysR family transcriptional regulator, glycine cleavage system transcriptional activator
VCMAKFQIPALNSLIFFEAAARHQSIKLACDELHVTHSAVSRHIRRVERQVGRDLFERHHRKIVLNNDGEILLRALATSFSHIQRAIAQLRRNRDPETLVISVDPDFAALWLVPRLAEFSELVPNTLVEILAERSLNSLDNPRVDCAIQYAPVGLGPENSEMLFRSRLFPVCAQGPTRQPLQSPEDLRHHMLLHDRSTVEWQEYIHSFANALDINVSSGAIFSETALCLDAAVRGQGVAMGDDFLAAIHLAEGRLVKPFDSALYSRNAYYFIAAKRDVKHAAVSAFRDWLFLSVDRVRHSLHVRRLDNG